MNTKNLAVVTALAILLVAATAALTTADNAFAEKKWYSEKSQVVAQANYCGSNSVQLPENVWGRHSITDSGQRKFGSTF